MISDSGIRFTVASRSEAAMAPGCVIRQRRDPANYFIRLPRSVTSSIIGFAKVTLKGCGLVETREGVHDVPRGSCLVTSFRDHLTYRAGPDGWEFVYMTFAGQGAQCLVEDLVATHGHVMAVDAGGQTVRGLCDLARGHGIRTMQVDTGTAVRMAGQVLIHLFEWNAERVDSEEQLIWRATRLLGADLSDPPSISQVARECDISREHLTRVFQTRMGMPPGQWVRAERLRHADLLLRSTDMPVADIARQVGFQTASAFIASFRADYGASPGRLRRDGWPASKSD